MESAKKEANPYAIYGYKFCNCKGSKCLLHFCDCLAAGLYCEDCCACEGCFNKPDYEDIVQDAIAKIELPMESVGSGKKEANLDKIDGKCMCKKSQCLNLRCKCFAAGIYCEDCCKCEGCSNKLECEDAATEARDKIEESNPTASAKPAYDPPDINSDGNSAGTLSARRRRGCNCMMSNCMKDYCVCYKAKVGCYDGCQCKMV